MLLDPTHLPRFIHIYIIPRGAHFSHYHGFIISASISSSLWFFKVRRYALASILASHSASPKMLITCESDLRSASSRGELLNSGGHNIRY